MLKKLFVNKKTTQVSSLLLSTVLSVGVGVLVSVLNTRQLGPAQYGDLKFIHSLLNFIAILSTFGYFTSGSRLLAKVESTKGRCELIGLLLILAAVLGCFFTFGLISFSFFQDGIFNNNLGYVIRLSSPLLFLFIFQICMVNLMQGDNRIYQLSIFKTLPQLLYFLLAFSISMYLPLDIISLIIIQIITLGLVVLVFVVLFKPSYQNKKKSLACVNKENKEYGIHTYYGSLVGVASAHVGGLSIAYFIDNEHVGYYSLAIMITAPLAMIPNVVGTTFFKDFTKLKSLPIKPTVLTILVSIFSLVVFIFICRDLVVLMYSNKYVDVVLLAYIVSIGYVFHGFGDYLNRFLGAKGRGKDLRNAAILVGVSNLLGFMLLVPLWGTIGAAITTLISGCVYISGTYYYYQRLIRA